MEQQNNKHLNHFKAILSELIQWDILGRNPTFGLKFACFGSQNLSQ
jgi:hypothetical protein